MKIEKNKIFIKSLSAVAATFLAIAFFSVSFASAATQNIAACKKAALLTYRDNIKSEMQTLKQATAKAKKQWTEAKKNYQTQLRAATLELTTARKTCLSDKPTLVSCRRAALDIYRAAISQAAANQKTALSIYQIATRQANTTYVSAAKIALSEYKDAQKKCLTETITSLPSNNDVTTSDSVSVPDKQKKPDNTAQPIVESPAATTTAQAETHNQTPANSPVAVSNFASGSISKQAVSLSWVSNTGIKYTLTNLTTGSSITTALTTYTFQNLTCGTTYTFRLVATDAQGDQSSPITINASTGTCVPLIINFVGIATSGQAAQLTWLSDTGIKYTLTNLTNGLSIDTALTSYAYQNLNCGTTYNFRLVATDIQGNQSDPVMVGVTTKVCAPPLITNFIGSSTGQTTIQFSWSSDTGVKYTLTNLANGLPIDTTLTSYTYQNLTCNTVYGARLIATDAYGNQSTPVTVSVRTQSCGPSITSFTVGAVTTQTVPLTWSSDSGKNYTLTNLTTGASVNTNLTSYTFQNLTCGTAYTFSIVATDIFGNQSAPSTVNTTTSLCAIPKILFIK